MDTMPFDITIAFDKNVGRYVHEPLFGGWVALTRGSILHRRCAGDLVSADRATALLPVVQHHLPKLQWSIVRFR